MEEPNGRNAEISLDTSNNTVYIGTTDSIRAVNNINGEILWEQQKSSLYSTFEAGILYLCDEINDRTILRIFALDVKTQKELWHIDVSSIAPIYNLTILSDLLIVNGMSGEIALNKTKGNQVWQNDETFVTKPVELHHIIYAKGSSHQVYAISPENGDVIGDVKLEDANPFIQQGYEVVAGVYKIQDGIVFNTEHEVVIYKSK